MDTELRRLSREDPVAATRHAIRAGLIGTNLHDILCLVAEPLYMEALGVEVPSQREIFRWCYINAHTWSAKHDPVWQLLPWTHVAFRLAKVMGKRRTELVCGRPAKWIAISRFEFQRVLPNFRRLIPMP